MEDDKISMNTLDYRLGQIESTLKKLEDLLIKNALQEKEIKVMKTKVDELENAINSHDKRIRHCEELPFKNKADKWQSVIDIGFKILATGFFTFLCLKLGLQP